MAGMLWVNNSLFSDCYGLSYILSDYMYISDCAVKDSLLKWYMCLGPIVSPQRMYMLVEASKQVISVASGESCGVGKG